MRRMTSAVDPRPSPATYVATFCYLIAGKYVPFESAMLAAFGDQQAKDMAIEWMNKNYGIVDDQTWLHVTCDGRGIYCQQLGTS